WRVGGNAGAPAGIGSGGTAPLSCFVKSPRIPAYRTRVGEFHSWRTARNESGRSRRTAPRAGLALQTSHTILRSVHSRSPEAAFANGASRSSHGHIQPRDQARRRQILAPWTLVSVA